ARVQGIAEAVRGTARPVAVRKSSGQQGAVADVLVDSDVELVASARARAASSKVDVRIVGWIADIEIRQRVVLHNLIGYRIDHVATRCRKLVRVSGQRGTPRALISRHVIERDERAADRPALVSVVNPGIRVPKLTVRTGAHAAGVESCAGVAAQLAEVARALEGAGNPRTERRQ